MSHGSYYNRIEVSRPGWVDPVVLPAYEVEASWKVNGAGTLSAILPAGTPPPGGGDWDGRWVFWRHFTQGAWGGVIEGDPVTIDDGALELSCVNFGQLLDVRRTPRLYRTQVAAAGALAQRALSDAATTEPLLWSSVVADEGGVWLTVEWTGEPVLDVFNQLASASGDEWVVDVADNRDVTLYWRNADGVDRRHQVLLVEGYQIVGGRFDRTIAPVRNDILAVDTDDQFSKADVTIVEDRPSIFKHGRRQTTRRYDGVWNAGAMANAAKAELTTLAVKQVTPTLTLRDTEPIATLIRESSVVRVHSWSAGKCYDFHVTSRHVSVNSGLLTLSGRATEA